MHFEEIVKRREEILKITHKNCQEIQEIKNMMTVKRIVDAEYRLKELLKRVENTREYPFCSVPVINVILSEKKKQCDKIGIVFRTELNLPEEVGVDKMDICCIFSNIMDNAICACKRFITENVEASIVLSAGVKGEYLIIKFFE